MQAVSAYTIEMANDLKWKHHQYDAAFCLYELAAQQGLSDGLFWMACAYRDGQGKERDMVKALELYKQAADLGNPSAAYQCGEAYRKGMGTAPDQDRAYSYYQYGANLGNEICKEMCEVFEMILRAGQNPQAQYEIGQKYEALQVRDTESAMEWYCKAAEGGHKEACMIGGFYYGGTVTGLLRKPAVDMHRSAAYFNKAADQGHLLGKKISSMMVKYGQVRDLQDVLRDLTTEEGYESLGYEGEKQLIDYYHYINHETRTRIMKIQRKQLLER